MDPRAALQSLVSRLRRVLPAGVLQAVPGGYRLAVARSDVDIVAFADRVARAREDHAPGEARAALALWRGDPWTPDGFDWVVRDLLEDRAHAERLAAAAPSDIPAAAPVEADPHPAVPAAVTALIGRTAELALIDAQLADERLVTLLGPGGAGKTTLALEAARRAPAAVFVELAPAAPGEVWDAVATALGRSIRLPDSAAARTSTRERVLEAVAGRTLLLVLDNAEHVAAETAAVAAALLQAAPTTRLLVTSREPLGVAGEAFVEVGALADQDAVDLLARRIRAARGRAVEPTETDAVARIARRLDGLPLALELAGAKARVLTAAEIETGLTDRFALLDRGPRTAAPRHQTLRAVIDWSWDLLTPDERDTLLVLAVFPDGVGVADLDEVATAFGRRAATVDDLVDRSLVQRRPGDPERPAGGVPRTAGRRHRPARPVAGRAVAHQPRPGRRGLVRRERREPLVGAAVVRHPRRSPRHRGPARPGAVLGVAHARTRRPADRGAAAVLAARARLRARRAGGRYRVAAARLDR
ncbi:MAG: NB-ARC domain-containing protein [Microbacterium sp.]|uniref:ATP-binding protein n=1 Tax=Microbacterium sp. TaxID=51671 RepID=UPI002621D1D8|nr:AAA family ATPase [Microbacterium sp.]MCX6502515.1 NB-ARC domain-containing protein [Microbacterium sp.]